MTAGRAMSKKEVHGHYTAHISDPLTDCLVAMLPG